MTAPHQTDTMQTSESSSFAATSSTHFASAGRFTIVSWNVDGLEHLCNTPEYQGRDLKTLLDGFDADIVCIQESKVRKRDEKQRDVPLPARFCSANDYCVVASTAAYGNRANPPEGLWGVTVCARKASVMPSKAETGLALGKRNQALRATERIGHYPDLDALDIPIAKLNTVEGEGRIAVLDCKVFVLISIYMPNLTKYEPGKKRDPAELAQVLRTVLQARVELLKAAGREVLVLGDFNVPPTSKDTHLGTVENCKKPGQRWFEEMTSPTGCALVDVHEHFRSGPEPPYTYFSGEKNKSRNLGTRIDLALATGGLMKWIRGAGIDRTKTGSDHLPIYVDLFESIDDAERGHLDLWQELNPQRDLSPQEARVPQLARELEEHLRSQKPLQQFFQPRGPSPTTRSTGQADPIPSGRPAAPKQTSKESPLPKKRGAGPRTVSESGALRRRNVAEVIDLCESDSAGEAAGVGPKSKKLRTK